MLESLRSDRYNETLLIVSGLPTREGRRISLAMERSVKYFVYYEKGRFYEAKRLA
jgi:hypothetical protein